MKCIECNSTELVENHHVIAEAVICDYTASMATSEGGRKHGINTIVKLTQKDIVNINEMQAGHDRRN